MMDLYLLTLLLSILNIGSINVVHGKIHTVSSPDIKDLIKKDRFVYLSGNGFLSRIDANDFTNEAKTNLNCTENFSILAKNSFVLACSSDKGFGRCSRVGSNACSFMKNVSFTDDDSTFINGILEKGWLLLTSSAGGRKIGTYFDDTNVENDVNIFIKESGSIKGLSFKGMTTIDEYTIAMANVRLKDNSTKVSSIIFKKGNRKFEADLRYINDGCRPNLRVVSMIKGSKLLDEFFIGTENRICHFAIKFGCPKKAIDLECSGSNCRLCHIALEAGSKEVSGIRTTDGDFLSGLYIPNKKLLLLGTSDGILQRYRVLGSEKLELIYSNEIADNGTGIILKENDDTFVYGLLKTNGRATEAFKIGIQDCYDYKSCSSCFSGDPSCMWCPMSQRCEPSASCPSVTKNVTMCPLASLVTPEVAVAGRPSIDIRINITTLTNDIPSNGTAKCKWYLPNNQIKFTAGYPEGRSIVCKTPFVQPALLKKERTEIEFAVLYNVRKTETPGRLADNNMTLEFLSCLYFDRCFTCQQEQDLGTARRSVCVWDAAELSCGVAKDNTRLPCPQFTSAFHIPNGIVSNITLFGKMLRSIPFTSKPQCHVVGLGKEFNFDFVIRNSTEAMCLNVNITVALGKDIFQTLSLTAFGFVNGRRMAIHASNDKPLNISIYECQRIDNCTSCRSYRYENYHCFWDTSQSKCLTKVSGFQKPTICGSLTLRSLSPRDGPFQGGTAVSFRGLNMQVDAYSLTNNVLLAGVPCQIKSVSASRKDFTCETKAIPAPKKGSLQVFNKTFKGRDFEFEYKNVSFISLSPSRCFTDLAGTLTIGIQNYMAGGARGVTVEPGFCEIGTELTLITNDTSQYQVKCPYCPNNTKEVEHDIIITVDGYKRKISKLFTLPFPQLIEQIDKTSIESGGVEIAFKSDFQNHSISLQLQLTDVDNSTPMPCSWIGRNVSCKVPPLPKTAKRRARRFANDYSKTVQFIFVTTPRGNITKKPLSPGSVTYVPDPVFKNISGNYDADDSIRIEAGKGTDLLSGARESDFAVLLDGVAINKAKIEVLHNVIIVQLKGLRSIRKKPQVRVSIQIGTNFKAFVGEIAIYSSGNSKNLVVALAIVIPTMVCVMFGILFWIRRKNAYKLNKERMRWEQDLDRAAADAATAARNAFTVMQTSMYEIKFAGDKELPYRNFEEFVSLCLVPNKGPATLPYIALDNVVYNESYHPTKSTLEIFDKDILNSKQRLLTLIQTFDKSAKIKDKTLLASAVSIVFINRMDFCYDIIESLLRDVVTKQVAERKIDSLQLLFRSSEYLVEKLFANWLTICLYSHLKNSDTGRRLYVLYTALHKYISQGLVDCYTNRATNVLSEDLLLNEEFEFEIIAITASYEDSEDAVFLEVLSRDSISQVKEKILGALHAHQPFSKRPKSDEFLLLWKRNAGSAGSENETSRGGYLQLDNVNFSYDKKTKQIYPIGHYNINNTLNNAHLVLKCRTSQSVSSVGGSSPSLLSVTDETALLIPEDGRELWHLTNPTNYENSTALPKDILLPYILKTKQVIQPFVSDLFRSILHMDTASELPQCVCHLFHILDEIVQLLPQDRPCNHKSLLHVWKSNTFILRVWINLLKNPQFLFDVDNTPTVNASLSVIAQALMDACSLASKSGSAFKSMPINKLIYFREVDEYQNWVTDFYATVSSNGNPPSQQDLSILSNEINREHELSEDVSFKAKQVLYKFARDFHKELLQNIANSPWLDSDEERESFAETIESLMSEESTSIV